MDNNNSIEILVEFFSVLIEIEKTKEELGG